MANQLKRAQRIQNNAKVIYQSDINDTIKTARNSPKYRSPILLNESFNDKPQRFVNCLTKKTYVRPHNHALTNHWELMSWLDGVVYVILFDIDGNITYKVKMYHSGVKLIEIPPNTYHSFITPNQGAYLEIRDCAYEPSLDRSYAPWAPAENTVEADHFLIKLFEAEETTSIITI